MSPAENSLDCTESGQAAAYALGALEAEEAERYHEHITSCEVCSELLTELTPVVDSLPESVPPVGASAQLRERVMAIVNAEAELLRAAGSAADRPTPSRTDRRRFALRLTLAGAGILAAGLAAGALLIGTGSNARSQHTGTTVLATSARGTRGVLREVGARGELIISGMPQPSKGKIYEVWLSRGKAPPQPTDALFSPTKAGRASVAVPGSLEGIKQVLVTAEPLGGSRHPTSTPVVVATIGSSA